MNESQINGIWVSANIIHGIELIDPIDIPADADLLSPKDFYESLSTLDNKTIFSYLSRDVVHQKVFELMETEYGIH